MQMLTENEIIDSQKLIIDTYKSFTDELMQAYGNIDHKSKSDDSPFTALDIKVEKTLKLKLLDEFPDFGFKGEETPEVISKNGATWHVDPIDGTSSFIHGLPYCSNMAGLVVDGEIVASVIYLFATDELFTAVKGQGAYKNGKQIFVNNSRLSNSIMFVNSFALNNIFKYYSSSKVQFTIPKAATGYIFTQLAQGNIQGVTFMKGQTGMHDFIPGALLTLEAGGQIVSFEDDKYNYKCTKFLAGTPNICNLTNQHILEIKKLV